MFTLLESIFTRTFLHKKYFHVGNEANVMEMLYLVLFSYSLSSKLIVVSYLFYIFITSVQCYQRTEFPIASFSSLSH
jgi:hypothetical protein